MHNVYLLRLDLTGGEAPGNKAYKLTPYLNAAQQRGATTLVSFGGVWSNHLHALAAIGARQGMQTVGVVRGGEVLTPTLRDAQRWGMQLLSVSRSEYRLRDEPDYQATLAAQFAPCLIIPEGGAGALGAAGCATLAGSVQAAGIARVMLPVGSGTTLAGLVSALESTYLVTGVSALKGALDLDERVRKMLVSLGAHQTAQWQILHDYHCGGFARVPAHLREFIGAFERAQSIALDPVYTAKTLYAVHQQRVAGQSCANEPTLVIHTGGLQGRRGFDWLD